MSKIILPIFKHIGRTNRFKLFAGPNYSSGNMIGINQLMFGSLFSRNNVP